MRKHFLILMLLTLLPFTAWAEDYVPSVSISDYHVVFNDGDAVVYDATAQAFPSVKLVANDNADYEIDANVTAVDWKRNGNAVTSITVAGTYKCTVQCDQLTGVLTNVELNVQRFPVTITALDINYDAVNEVAGDELMYGATAAAVEAKYELEFGALPDAINDDEDLRNALIASFNSKVTTYETDYEQWGDMPNGYFTYLPIIDALDAAYSNYTFTPIYGKIYIHAKDLTTVNATVKNREYDGTNYAPTYEADVEGAYNGLVLLDTENNKTLRPGIDYELTYYTELDEEGNVVEDSKVEEFDDADNHDLTNAGTYYALVYGIGKYFDTKVVLYQVTKKALAVTTVGAEFNYSGLAQEVGDLGNYVTFEGLIDDDKDGENPNIPAEGTYIDDENKIGVKLYKGTVAPANVTAADAVINAGTYKVVAAAPVNNVNLIFKNYKVVYWNTGEIVVNKAPLTFVIKNQEGELDGSHPLETGVTPSGDDAAATAALYFTVTGLKYGAGETDPKDAISVYPTVKVNKANQNDDGTYPIVFKMKTDGKTIDGFKIKSGDNDVTANYDYTGKITFGKFTTSLILLGARPSNATITYGEVSKEQMESGAVPATITVSVGDGAGDDKAALETLLKGAVVVDPVGTELGGDAEVVYPNAGTYALVLDLDKIDFSAYENKYTVSVFPGTLTINKKALDITLNKQSLTVGEGEDALVANAFTVNIEGTEYDDDKDDLYDAMNDAGVFAIDADKLPEGGIDADLTDAAIGENEDAIILIEDAGVFANYTYTVGEEGTVTPGTLFVNEAGLELAIDVDSDYDEDYYLEFANKTDEVVEADNDKLAFSISGDRILKKQVWETLVLPFNTSVVELNQLIDCYAVVDILDESKNDGDIHFNLHMGNIPANTPFLIKTYKAVNLSNVVFGDKTIIAPAQFTEDGDPYIADQAGHKYVGLYDLKEDLTGNGIWALNQNGIFKELKTKTTDLQATKAYLDLAGDTEARILIEEPDGTTTAISTVNTEVVTNVSTGWYTINGMKLNSMPTEKGIYILNGKKIVVK